MFALDIMNRIGQFDGKTGGKKLVDWISDDLEPHVQRAIMDDFSRSERERERLHQFASIVCGMGNDIHGIHKVDRVGPPSTLSAWYQEASRCGRDKKDSKATLYLTPGERWRMDDDMKEFTKARRCLRMLIVNTYNPTYTWRDIWDSLRGSTDNEKAERCCFVCKERKMTPKGVEEGLYITSSDDDDYEPESDGSYENSDSE